MSNKINMCDTPWLVKYNQAKLIELNYAQLFSPLSTICTVWDSFCTHPFYFYLSTLVNFGRDFWSTFFTFSTCIDEMPLTRDGKYQDSRSFSPPEIPGYLRWDPGISNVLNIDIKSKESYIKTV